MHIFLLIILLFVLSACNASVSPVIQLPFPPSSPPLQINRILSPNDQDQDGVDDFSDIVQNARAQIGVVTEYDTSYYQNAYPPANKGACADVIWRTLKDAGYDFKTMIDTDMKKYPDHYKKEPVPDSNINFRRVENIRVFLDKYAQKLPTEVIPFDESNLSEWQGGDIVTYAQIPGGLWHVAVISDKRREDGVPLLIHNYGRGVKEDNYLLDWPTQITGHYRWVLE